MKTKQRVRMEIKGISEDGSFEGILSPYNKVDLGNEVVLPGAYTKTLKDNGNTVPMLWQHKSDVPIGELTLEDRPDGLWCKGQLLMALAEAQKAYLLIKARIVKGLSIGFTTVREAMDGTVRQLKEIRLYEGSIVTFPMSESAVITSVKALVDRMESKDDFNEELTEIQLEDAGCQMRTALNFALSSIFWSGLTREEIISAAGVIIQQFSDSYLAYVPAYLDMLAERYGDLEMWAANRRLEVKAGRMISNANVTTIQTAHGHMKSAMDLLYPLTVIDAEAGDEEDDSGITSKAAAGPPETPKPAPVVPDHSAIEGLIDQMKALYRAA